MDAARVKAPCCSRWARHIRPRRCSQPAPRITWMVSPWAVGTAAVQDTSVIDGYDEGMHQAMMGWLIPNWGELTRPVR